MIAIAALSARALVEQALRDDGERCVALDLFGDADTLRAAASWAGIGDGQTLKVCGDRLLAEIDRLAQRDAVSGWIAGSGFEGDIDLLEAAAARLPLLGTAPTDWRRLRDPHGFFGFLDARGIVHPAVRFEPPAVAAGWLLKGCGGSGGRQVRRAAGQGAAAHGDYWQQESRGTPMSATFVANGRDGVLLGFNEQTVLAIGDRPFVFAGIAGPVAVPAAVAQQIDEATRLLAREYRLRGLGSVDFLLDGDNVLLLEVNPRPPASSSLYPGALRAHRRACLHGELPRPSPPSSASATRTLFAHQALQLDATAATMLAAQPDAHDLPHAGARFAAGEPICSLSASGPDALALQAELARRAHELLYTLETTG